MAEPNRWSQSTSWHTHVFSWINTLRMTSLSSPVKEAATRQSTTGWDGKRGLYLFPMCVSLKAELRVEVVGRAALWAFATRDTVIHHVNFSVLQEQVFHIDSKTESGKGRCSFNPEVNTVSVMLSRCLPCSPAWLLPLKSHNKSKCSF